MGRPKRLWLQNNFYHVTCRGNRKEPIFLDEYDFRVFLSIIKRVHEKTPLEVCSYCLMTNHYHLLIRSTHTPISNVMFQINKRYATYFNRRYQLTGHVFEKRFYDNLIESRTELLTVSRYIHLNPVKARIVPYPDLYIYSSMLYFFSTELHKTYPFVDINPILNFFVGCPATQRQKYYEWCCREPVNSSNKNAVPK